MRPIVVAGVSLLTIFLAGPSAASGFLAARFGGEHGHPTTANPTAIYYNPAGLSLTGGTRIYLDGTFALRHASYDRPASAISHLGSSPEGQTPEEAIGANAGRGELTNLVSSPFAAVVSDLGVKNLGVGAAFYVPFGGTAVWGRNKDFEGNELGKKYPGAEDGVQRWFTEDGEITSLYFTLAGSYTFEGPRLSFGAGLNLINNVLHTVRARNVDGSDDLVTADGALKEGRSLIEASGWDFGASAGVIWQPIDDLWLGFSYQSRPGFGDSNLDGTLDVSLGGQESQQEIRLVQGLPDVYRLGARWRPDPEWELRLFGEYVRWSTLQKQCFLSREPKDARCDLNDDGSAKPGSASNIVQNIPRQWKDAFGVRAGASYWISAPFEVYLGAGYDSNAIPSKTLDPSLYDMNKATASIGSRFEIGHSLAFAATFTQVFYAQREISVEESQPFEAPSKQPNAAGTYKQSISVLNVNGEYTF